MVYLDMSSHVCINGTAIFKNFVDYQERILNMQVHDDDVWVVSFPKSGTTWTQEMVWLLANNLDYNAAQQNLNERFPFLEITSIRPNVSASMEPNTQIPFENSVDCVEKLKRPRFIKTHLAWEFLPLQIQDGHKKPKMIYVARNPKDVCVSYYYHTRIFHGFGGTLEDFCEYFLTDKSRYKYSSSVSNTPQEGRNRATCFIRRSFDQQRFFLKSTKLDKNDTITLSVPYCPYWNNVLGYWNKRNEHNMIFIKYEEMKEDMPSVLNKVARFLGTQLNEEEVDKLNSHLSFEAMKNNNAVNNKKAVESFKKNKVSPFTGDFLRRGIAGGYKSEMKEATVNRFDEWIEGNTAGTSLKFSC